MPKKRKNKRKVKKKYKSKPRKDSRNRKKFKTTDKKSSEKIYKVKSEWLKKALVSRKIYEKKYSHSLKDNEGFWRKEGKRITWIKPYTKIKDVKYSSSEVSIKW